MEDQEHISSFVGAWRNACFDLFSFLCSVKPVCFELPDLLDSGKLTPFYEIHVFELTNETILRGSKRKA